MRSGAHEGLRQLSPERERLYAELREQIGNTPLVEYQGPVPNGGKIMIKLESENPYGGNHYDRVYLDLLYEKERRGIITPGQVIFETTSGSAGVSFGEIGRQLGYECHVAIPAGGERAREEAIRATGATLHFTPEDKYIDGFPRFIKSFLKEHPDAAFINHSMGDITGRGQGVNEVAVGAVEPIAREVVQQRGGHYTHAVSAIGNGTNTLGLARGFQQISPQTQVIGFEPLSAGVVYDYKYGEGQYQARFGINPRDFSRHRLPGTSYASRMIDFPAQHESAAMLSDILLVADEKTLQEYARLSGNGQLPPGVVQWDRPDIQQHVPDMGRTTVASIAVALAIAEANPGAEILVIGYDKANRYDSPT